MNLGTLDTKAWVISLSGVPRGTEREIERERGREGERERGLFLLI